ncbi:hypothetical protein DERP_001898 [Dermatophagoides pteronyssinus]|nr:hypothetical protein DERP_001898 [Dermatophagoides pteronyssinus]
MIQLFLIIQATNIPMVYSLFLYAVHDFVGHSPPKIDAKQTNDGFKDQNLMELIERGKNLSTTAHKKLFEHKDNVKINKYRRMVVQDLDYLELIIKRAESFIPCVNNPFMAKLIAYTRKDLEVTIDRFEVIMMLYDQGDDQSMPTLTLFVQQLIDQSNNDVGYLNSHGHCEYADKISEQSARIQKMLLNLKEQMDQLDDRKFSNNVRQLLVSMIDFENLILEAEKQSNINSVIH